MPRDQQQRVTYLGVAGEFLGAVYEPKVEAILHRTEIAGQLGMVALGIVDEVSRMHFEEAGQQHARRVGEVRARAAFYLREIGLAKPAAHFFFESAGEILLGHLAAESAQRAFDEAEVAEFFAEFHNDFVLEDSNRQVQTVIMICNLAIAIRYVKKR